METPKGCRLSCYVTLGCLWPFSYENYHYFILKKNDIGTEKKPQITLELVHSLKCLVPTMYLRSGAAVRGTHARRAHDLLNLDVRPTKFSTRSTFFFLNVDFIVIQLHILCSCTNSTKMYLLINREMKLAPFKA